MATKKAIPTRELRQHELPAWLTGKIEDSSIQALADSLGTARQTISGFISGRREPGKRILAKMKKIGLVDIQRLYVVRDDRKKAGR